MNLILLLKKNNKTLVRLVTKSYTVRILSEVLASTIKDLRQILHFLIYKKSHNQEKIIQGESRYRKMKY